jgi:hypothetical protein
MSFAVTKLVYIMPIVNLILDDPPSEDAWVKPTVYDSVIVRCAMSGRKRMIRQTAGFRDEPPQRESLWKLYGLLRWLAADRGAWTPGPTGKAMSIQYRTSMFDL